MPADEPKPGHDERHKLRRVEFDPSRPLAELAGIPAESPPSERRIERHGDSEFAGGLQFGKLADQDPAARPHIDRRRHPLAAALLAAALALAFGVGGWFLLREVQAAAGRAGERRNQELLAPLAEPTR